MDDRLGCARGRGGHSESFVLSDLVIFVLSILSLIPVAGLIGEATDQLAHHLGPRIGGLLNATFGNAAELIITGFAVHRGLLTLAKASLTGSVIGNTLLVLGMSLLVGGTRHGVQRYDGRQSSLNAAMMILAVPDSTSPPPLPRQSRSRAP